MVTPIIFLLAINYKKRNCSIFNNVRDTAHPKSTTFAKLFLRFCISKSIQERTFLQSLIQRKNTKLAGDLVRF